MSIATRPDGRIHSQIDRILAKFVQQGMPARRVALLTYTPHGRQLTVLFARTQKVSGVNKALKAMTLLQRIR